MSLSPLSPPSHVPWSASIWAIFLSFLLCGASGRFVCVSTTDYVIIICSPFGVSFLSLHVLLFARLSRLGSKRLLFLSCWIVVIVRRFARDWLCRVVLDVSAATQSRESKERMYCTIYGANMSVSVSESEVHP